MKESVLSFEE